MVSAAVKDLVHGSGISYADEGDRQLKGIEETRRLYPVESMAG